MEGINRKKKLFSFSLSIEIKLTFTFTFIFHWLPRLSTCNLQVQV